MNDGWQLPASRRPGLDVRGGGRAFGRNLHAKRFVALRQLLGEREHILVRERPSFEVEQARAGVANLLAKLPAGAEQAQRAPIVKLIRRHYALLCACRGTNPTRHPRHIHTNNNLTSGRCQAREPVFRTC
jgi:hypothetical protein